MKRRSFISSALLAGAGLLSSNLALALETTNVDILKRYGELKNTSPASIALAWLLAKRPYIVPIPGSTNITHIAQNISALNVNFSADELAGFDKEIQSIKIAGERLPDRVLKYSYVEAPFR